MKERPILFSAPMVRALLAGTKTQTRRIVKPQQPRPSTCELYELELTQRDGAIKHYTRDQFAARYPSAAPGDRLWVRETHQLIPMHDDDICVYRASCEDDSFMYADPDGCIQLLKVERWLPSIFMRRMESRISLDVIAVRVERLQDISGDDAIAEGIDPASHRCDCDVCRMQSSLCPGSLSTLVLAYADLWRDINGAESWDANPWVWVVSFKRVEAAQ